MAKNKIHKDATTIRTRINIDAASTGSEIQCLLATCSALITSEMKGATNVGKRDAKLPECADENSGEYTRHASATRKNPRLARNNLS